MTYGNDHECTITALKNMEFDVQFFDVEGHWQCAYDWLEVGGTRYCGDSTTPHGIRVTEGEQFTWNTDYSVTRDGWEICMRDFLWAPKDTHNRWCVEANRDDFTLEDSSHPGWALHDAAGYGYRWCGVTVDECKSLSQGIDGVIGFYMTSNGCCFPMKNECFGSGCPGHGCRGADSGTYMIIDQDIEHLDGSTWCPAYQDRESCLGARDPRNEFASACGWCCGQGCADGAGHRCEPTEWLMDGTIHPPFVNAVGHDTCVEQAQYVGWEPQDRNTRWCVEANRDDFTLADSSHPGWALHDAAGYGYRWCSVTVDECKELSEGIDGVIGFYRTSNSCCFPMKNQCSGSGCPGSGCNGADSGTYMRTPWPTVTFLEGSRSATHDDAPSAVDCPVGTV